MVIVEAPNTRLADRNYSLETVLGEFLGLSWSYVPSECADVSIRVSGREGELILPDLLLQASSKDWLTERSMPVEPLPVWDTSELGLEASIVDKRLPVIYGDSRARASHSGDKIQLPIDIFGSAFFMLTRYEELVRGDRDAHDRFPSTASLAYRQGFLDRPIIDEYVEVLWAAMQRLWPGLRREQHEFQIKVSHDVDRPTRYGFRPVKPFLRAMTGDVFKYQNISGAVMAPWVRLATRRRLHSADSFNTFDWLMDVSEANNLQSAFYFICGRTDQRKDADYEPEHPAIRDLMRSIYRRGHEIGLHPSYGTYQKPELIGEEASRLKRICAEEGIEQDEWGGRMHYLRWQHPTTMYGWENAGMTYDSTLGYADRPGFRCGTCHEYRAFDPVRGQKLNIRLRPLIAMECSITAPQYMGLGTGDEAYRVFDTLKERCRMVRGYFTLLWHNSELMTKEARNLYKQVLA